jgi:membrane associated rhomboid family serine protease
MIPIGDSVRSRTFPYVNIAIILANFLVFFYEVGLGTQVNQFIFDWGVTPIVLTDFFDDPGRQPFQTPFTPLTAMFIHGGWFHILGNMLFLWVFGDNVEDALGHLPYLLFYLLAGIAATAVQVVVDSDSILPMIGASGAIAGVLGAYWVVYPRASVSVLIPPIFFWAFRIPAFLLIGFWFFLQLFNGVATLGYDAVGAGGGVAWWAHIGGFAAGVILLWLFRPQRPRPRIGPPSP